MAKDAPKNSGKAPSIQFYYKDFLAKMLGHHPVIVGGWMLLLCKIWHEKNQGKVTKTLTQFARIMQCSKLEAQEILDYIRDENIADVLIGNCESVTGRNKNITDDNTKITVINRRAYRDAKLKENNALRQKRHREKAKKQENNGDVTDQNLNPSTSSSTSVININTYTEENPPITFEQFEAIGNLNGLTKEQCEKCYHHYNAQGWVRANGQKITDYRSAIITWRLNQNEKPNSKSKWQKNQRQNESGKHNNGQSQRPTLR